MCRLRIESNSINNFRSGVMMNKNIILMGVGGLVLGFTVGRVSYLTQDTDEFSQDPITVSSETTHVKKTNSQKVEIRSPKPRVSRAVKTRSEASLVLADLEDLLGRGYSSESDYAAIAESYEMIKKLDENELAESLDLLIEKPDQFSNPMYMKMLLSRYSELNSSAAINFYESNITKPRQQVEALKAIMSSWSKDEPEAAFAWYKTQEENDVIKGVYGAEVRSLNTIFKGLADLETALERLSEVNITGYKGSMAAYGISSSLSEKEEFELFFDKTKDLGNQQVRTTALRSWANKNPEEAAAWSSALEDEKQRQASSIQVFSNWVGQDGDKAVSWYMENSTKKPEDTVVDVVQSWTRQDPAAAGKWLEAQGLEENQRAVDRFVNQSSWSNPGVAADYVDYIKDDKKRQQKVKSIYRNWARQDKEKADAFINKYENAAEIRKSVEPSLNRRLQF